MKEGLVHGELEFKNCQLMLDQCLIHCYLIVDSHYKHQLSITSHSNNLLLSPLSVDSHFMLVVTGTFQLATTVKHVPGSWLNQSRFGHPSFRVGWLPRLQLDSAGFEK